MELNKRNILYSVRKFLAGRFNLSEDSAPQSTVEEIIRKSVEFRGQNLWILIFAIFIASVGLNVNSTAVIIGAMLVSPLMGPIMGFGLSLGIYDFELLKRSFRNLIFAVVVSLITSSVYFMLSPLSVAQSEILARTTPTIWDVLIALFGGLAGIVAQTRTDRTSTVIPGVAIATALMPPLCTAGYGLGTFQWNYFIGALYLFTINAVLISIATFIFVRYLNYEKKQQINSQTERKVKISIYCAIFVTIVPSCILGYNIVTKTLFEANSKEFVNNSFKFKNTQVVDFTPVINDGEKELRILLLGESLSEDAIAALQNQRKNYSLNDVKLVIQQQGTDGVNAYQSIEKLYNVSSLLVEEKDEKIKELQKVVELYYRDTLNTSSISKEFSALTNENIRIALSRSALYNSDGTAHDTMLLCIIKSPDSLFTSKDDYNKMISWLKARTKTHKIELVQIVQPVDTTSVK